MAAMPMQTLASAQGPAEANGMPTLSASQGLCKGIVLCWNVGGKQMRRNHVAKEFEDALTSAISSQLARADLDISMVCLQEVGAHLLKLLHRDALEADGSSWEVVHMPHMDLFTAWRVSNRPGKPEGATWGAVCPVQAQPIFETGANKYRWWRGYLQARGREGKAWVGGVGEGGFGEGGQCLPGV